MNKSNRRYVVLKRNRPLSLKENEVGKVCQAILEHKSAQRKKIDTVSKDAITTKLLTGRRKRNILS